MEATLTSTTAAHTSRRRHSSSLRITLGVSLRRLRATIVQGSDHPVWRQSPSGASFSLLPSREQNRLLDAGHSTSL